MIFSVRKIIKKKYKMTEGMEQPAVNQADIIKQYQRLESECRQFVTKISELEVRFHSFHVVFLYSFSFHWDIFFSLFFNFVIAVPRRVW